MSERPLPHPGKHVRKYMEANKLNVTQLADRLGVTRPSTSNLLNGHNGITAKMALRLERIFSRPARWWLTLQLNYDLQRAMENAKERR